MARAYDKSSTFRRLFNFAYKEELKDPNKRWLICPDEEFGTTITDKQIASAAGQRMILLNMDPSDCAAESYHSNDVLTPTTVAEFFSGIRSVDTSGH